MCTVSFIPLAGEVLLTSNRDEQRQRSPAHAPDRYHVSGGTAIYPKDGQAGGTWFAVHDRGLALVLLNGAGAPHHRQPPYRKSRGLVLLDMLGAADPGNSFEQLDLCAIEPFTLIAWQARQLYEFRWDGVKKFQRMPDPEIPHIWSSVTLYSPTVIHKREQWFAGWLQEHALPTQDDVLHFHEFTGEGDAHNDLRMNRNGQVATVSITSARIGGEGAQMEYLDLLQDRETRCWLNFQKTVVGNP